MTLAKDKVGNKKADEQIIKALECCATDDGDDCSQCLYGNIVYKSGNGGCVNRCRKDALDLVNRQKKEIERLKRKNTILSKNADTAFQDGLDENRDLFKKEIEPEIRNEAIKEFAKFLIEKSKDGKIFISDIPDYVKEMTEAKA